MELSHKDEAERLRLGLLSGWLQVSDAVAWADREIARTAVPPRVLVEIALAVRRSRQEVAALLSEVPGTADGIGVMKACLADLRGAVERQPDLSRDAARWITAAALRGDLPDEHFGSEPVFLDDEFCLVDQGIFTREQAHERLLAFLIQYGSEV